MADSVERIVIDVDDTGAVKTLSSANKQVAALEVGWARVGQAVEQRYLAKIAQAMRTASGDPLRIKELQALQQNVFTRMGQNLDQTGGKFAGLGARIKDAIQNPLQAAGNAAEGFLNKLGLVGVAAGAAAVGIGMAAKAGWDAMKSLGNYGDELQDTASRMGLTTQETEKFRLAMRSVGGDMGSLENVMRKLSQEIDTGGKTLKELNVDYRDFRTGELLPTSQIILNLATKFRDLPEGPIRNAAAIKVMGRAALEVLPDLVELPVAWQRSNEIIRTTTDEQLKHFSEYESKVAEIETAWERLKRSMKEPLAATIFFLIKRFEETADANKALSAEPNQMERSVARADAASGGPGPSRNALGGKLGEWLNRPSSDWSGGLTSMLQSGRVGMFAPTGVAEKLMESYSTPNAARVAQGNSLIDAVLGSNAEERLNAAKEKLKGVREELEKMHGLYPEATASKRAEVAAAQAAVKAAQSEVDAPRLAKEATKNQRDWFLKTQKWREKQMSDTIADNLKSTPEIVPRDYIEEYNRYLKEQEYARELANERLRASLDRNAAAGRSQSTHAERMAEMSARPGDELATAQKVYALRIQSIEAERQTVEAHSELYDIDQKRAELQQEMQQAGYDYEEKIAELERSRFDKLKSSMEGLLDAAFARSKSILDALKGMAEAVFLTPIKEGISSVMARAIMPVMYGRDGNGGIMGRINGLFGGGGINNVKLIGGAVPVYVTGGGGASSGEAGSYLPGVAGGAVLGGLFAGGGAMSRAGEVIGGGSSTAGLTQMASGLWRRGPVDVANIVGGPGNTSGFAGPVGGYGGSSSSGVGSVAQAGGWFGGMKGMLSSLGNLGRGTANQGPMPDGSVMASGQHGVGGAAGGAMLLGGGILAVDGLRRGGWAGVGETTAGGALIGAKFGGPYGAAIGAGIGFVAGLIRLGIKSAAEKVIEKVRTLYGVTLNKSTAQQIVEIANQKYAKNLDMAVRSQEVRDLVKLYAQTMGQKTNLIADSVHSASLIEARGGLYQGAVYDNGQAYSYASKYGVYGGVQTQSLQTGSPYGGGSVNLTLNVNGQSAAALLDGRIAPAISSNPRLVASSALNGSRQSATRSGFAVNTLAPSVITQ